MNEYATVENVSTQYNYRLNDIKKFHTEQKH